MRNTVRVLTASILLLLTCFCGERNKAILTNDVFVVLYPDDFEGKEITVKDSTRIIRFTNEFWNYFLKSHPRVSVTIFSSWQYEEHYPYFDTKDSTYSYYIVGAREGDLGQVLADTAGGVEKPGQQSGIIWKKETNDNLLNYQARPMTVSNDLAQEFARFKFILSYRDSIKQYVIVYRNKFLTQ